MPGNVYKILCIFYVHNFLYVNSSNISWVTQRSERLSDAHRHTVSSVRPGIHLKPVWLQRLYVLFPLYQRFPTQLFIRIKGEQCKYKFLGPTPDLLNQNLYGGGYAWESILKVRKVSLITSQVWESCTVYTPHTFCFPKNKSQVIKRGTCSIIHLAVVLMVRWGTTALR